MVVVGEVMMVMLQNGLKYEVTFVSFSINSPP